MRKQDNVISLLHVKMSYRSWENWFCENTWWVNFGRQKQNQIQQYFILLLLVWRLTFEKTTKNQGEESCKNQSENKKSSTFFAAWRKVYYGAAKERWKSSIKKTKKSQLFWNQLYFNCVKSVATLALFPAVL